MSDLALKAVYLIAGSDRPKVERAVDRLRSHFDPDAVERLLGTEVGGEETVASCNALGLFGGGSRLVLVVGVDRWKAADAAAIADYLRSPTPETVLALVGDDVKKDSALARACAKAGDVLLYESPRRNLSAIGPFGACSRATMTPSAPPRAFVVRSTIDWTRVGRNACSTSMLRLSEKAATTANTAATTPGTFCTK